MESNPTIYIVGAGAIGKALGVFLKLAGKKVVIIRGSIDDGSIETTNICVTLADESRTEVTLEVATFSSLNVLNGIIVLTNKSYGNEQLASTLKTKANSSPIVLLQNGLGVEKHFISCDFKQIYRCVLYVTSQLITPTLIRFKPVTPCPVGIVKGDEHTLSLITKALHTSQFQFKAETDLQKIIWKKAIVNTVFNSVCPLLEADNGIFYRNQHIFVLAKRIIDECTAIANAMHINLSIDEVVKSLLQISKLADGQMISTWQDIHKGNRTEIDTLNFEIVRIAEGLGQLHAVKETKLLGELIELKSALRYAEGR